MARLPDDESKMNRRTSAPGDAALAAEDFLLLSAILLLPWAFGGVEIWAYRSAAFLLVLGAGLAVAKEGASGLGLRGRTAWWILPAFLLALWAALQIVPLPPPLIRALSPEAHVLYSDAFPGYGGQEARDGIAALEARALELVPETAGLPLPRESGPAFQLREPACLRDRFRTLSLEPSATLERLLWYLALLFGFGAIRRRVAERGRRRFYSAAVCATLTALAVFALIQAQTWNGRIFWFRTPSVESSPFGPYVNPNHFAGAMELGVPALAAFAWSRLRRAGRAALYEARFTAAALACVTCLVAGLGASSKTAAVLFVASLVFLGVLGARSLRLKLAVVGVATLAIAAGTVLLSGTMLGERVASYVARADTGQLLEGREAVWQASGAMLLDFPLTGSGFGTFREVFPRYTPPGALARFAQAHNDYLEVLLEGGIPGFALLLWLIVVFGMRVRAQFRQLEEERRLVSLGTLAGVLALATHALFDFNHQIPANALLFITMCALLVPVRLPGGGSERPA